MKDCLKYKVKCRGCGKITEMFFAFTKDCSSADFKKFIQEHLAFPIEKQCDCDNGSMLFHDIISYDLLFDN